MQLGFQQAEHFCNSIGILQQFAPPSKFSNFDRSGSQTPQQQSQAQVNPTPTFNDCLLIYHLQEDYVQLFTTLIARCAKDIDTLIESLPSEENSTELQVSFILLQSKAVTFKGCSSCQACDSWSRRTKRLLIVQMQLLDQARNCWRKFRLP